MIVFAIALAFLIGLALMFLENSAHVLVVITQYLLGAAFCVLGFYLWLAP